MTARLESALKQLSEDEIEQLTRFAESLAAGRRAGNSGSPTGWKLDWVGGLKDCPERSGLEAQHTAMREWAALLEKKPS